MWILLSPDINILRLGAEIHRTFISEQNVTIVCQDRECMQRRQVDKCRPSTLMVAFCPYYIIWGRFLASGNLLTFLSCFLGDWGTDSSKRAVMFTYFYGLSHHITSNTVALGVFLQFMYISFSGSHFIKIKHEVHSYVIIMSGHFLFVMKLDAWLN